MKAKEINEWWNGKGCEIRDFLSDLSGDRSFHKKLHISDAVNVHNYMQTGKVPAGSGEEDDLLKGICAELAEGVLVVRNGVSVEALYDAYGCYYPPYQDEYNRLYDRIEQQMTYFKESNQN
jgi:hypothetical protein